MYISKIDGSDINESYQSFYKSNLYMKDQEPVRRPNIATQCIDQNENYCDGPSISVGYAYCNLLFSSNIRPKRERRSSNTDFILNDKKYAIDLDKAI
jgi:hypothetical protein